MLIMLFLVSHSNFLFVPCGRLSWLPVSVLLHVKYPLSYRIVTRGRQTVSTIDWMKSNDVEYEHIKKIIYDREDWRHWRPGPA